MRKGDVDRVLIVGGSSRIPKVRELLTREFGREPNQVLNPDEAIADGAAVLAFQLANPGVLGSKGESFFSVMYDAFASMTGAETAGQQSHEITVRDVAAHSLGVTYWAGDCTVGQIKGTNQLAERLIREGAKSGDVRVSLMWNDVSDLDVHVITPSSQEIYFGSKRSSCGGELDVDMNAGSRLSETPVENVYWSRAPHGSYVVYVHMYKNRNARGEASSFSGEVEVGGVVSTFQGSVRSNSDRVEVARFRFDGIRDSMAVSTSACERKMKIIVPKNSPLPFRAAPQDFVVSPRHGASPAVPPAGVRHKDLILRSGHKYLFPVDHNVALICEYALWRR